VQHVHLGVGEAVDYGADRGQRLEVTRDIDHQAAVREAGRVVEGLSECDDVIRRAGVSRGQRAAGCRIERSLMGCPPRPPPFQGQ
jgi:hypothetical protein